MGPMVKVVGAKKVELEARKLVEVEAGGMLKGPFVVIVEAGKVIEMEARKLVEEEAGGMLKGPFVVNIWGRKGN